MLALVTALAFAATSAEDHDLAVQIAALSGKARAESLGSTLAAAPDGDRRDRLGRALATLRALEAAGRNDAATIEVFLEAALDEDEGRSWAALEGAQKGAPLPPTKTGGLSNVSPVAAAPAPVATPADGPGAPATAAAAGASSDATWADSAPAPTAKNGDEGEESDPDEGFRFHVGTTVALGVRLVVVDSVGTPGLSADIGTVDLSARNAAGAREEISIKFLSFALYSLLLDTDTFLVPLEPRLVMAPENGGYGWSVSFPFQVIVGGDPPIFGSSGSGSAISVAVPPNMIGVRFGVRSAPGKVVSFGGDVGLHFLWVEGQTEGFIEVPAQNGGELELRAFLAL